MIEAVIFDIDGTLVDTVDLHARAWKEAFEHFGHPLQYGEIRDQIGKGGDQLIPHFLPPVEVERIGAELDAWRGDLFKREYLSSARPFPHVRDLFQRLKADGIRTALASSGKKGEVNYYVGLMEIPDLVDVIVSSDEVERSKPHPDVFSVALKKLGLVRTDKVVVVGDSPYDIEAAKRAGLRALAVLSGGFTASQLRQAGALGLYEDPADLLHRYESWQSPRGLAAQSGVGRQPPSRH